MFNKPASTILVVDDNPAGRYATSRVLRAAGFSLLEAATGNEGLAMVPKADLVVLDVNLPDISGFEVCRRIRSMEKTARIPVIHLSASFVRDTDKVEGLDAGADGYLTHPVEPPVLVATVNAFLRTRRAEDKMKGHEAERERLLAAERAARAEAERANRLKDEFLATLSHELRTPLNAIVGWAQILKGDNVSPEDLAEGIDAIDRNAQAQAQLIADLLDVSRITSGKLRLDIRAIDLAAPIKAALETMAPAIQAKGIQLRHSLNSDVGTIQGDPDRVQQVIWNLVNNAVKFTRKGGIVQVNLAQVNSHASVTVSDNGQGISPDFLPHIFERFRQEDATSKRNQGGLGLGLAIVKHLVEMHGGTISAQSEGDGRGSTFTVLIPISAMAENDTAVVDTKAPADAGGGGPPLPPLTLNNLRILIVDDDADARAVLKRVLVGSGANVSDAADVPAALALLSGFKPQILISDVGIPRQDGYDLIRTVRAGGHSPDELPAIALTAFARTEDRSASMHAGFQLHLSKPVDAGELLRAVSSLTEHADTC